MASLYLRRLPAEDRNVLVDKLLESQGGNCFICGNTIALPLQSSKIDIDHMEPTSEGGKDNPQNFAVTHQECNRSKQASDLRVARVLARFDALAQRLKPENRSPNLGDVLAAYGGMKHRIPVKLSASSLEISFSEAENPTPRVFPLFKDQISGFTSCFVDLPIEYLHHDDHINPRAIGSNLRKLVIEFHKGFPQLHVSLGWIDTSSGQEPKVMLFDGQHKAAAQILLGARHLPVRIFVDPNIDVLLTANTNAGTTLRQVAFDKSVQRSLGSSILSKRIDRYRLERNLGPDDESFSEQDLVSHFKGESRAMRRYVVDRVRDGITTHPENKLREYIEFGGRGTGKPLSYSTIEKTFFQFFVCNAPLGTAFNFRIQEGANPRQLEIEQVVRLMDIVADGVYVDQFDFDRGARRIESDVQKGEDVAEPHLRAFRMSKEEIVHNWVRSIRQIVFRHLVLTGKLTDEEKMFQQVIPESCWKSVENFVEALVKLPVWVNRDLSISVFGTKHNNDFWQSIFQTGFTPDGAVVMPEGLDLDEMARGSGTGSAE